MKEIEEVLQNTNATITDGVLSIEFDRSDLHITGPDGVPFKPAWEANGTFTFQSLGDGKAIMNSDFCLLPEETNPFIDKLIKGGISVEAFHQHFFGLNPMVFFRHFRGIGDPIRLARAAIAAVKVTGTPLPQKAPSHPTTPLPVKEMSRIIGVPGSVSDSGVVNFSVPRAKEINPALAVSRAEGFEVHCLYNQETDEQPQLYFSHNFKVGDPISLAKGISNVLAKTNVRRS